MLLQNISYLWAECLQTPRDKRKPPWGISPRCARVWGMYTSRVTCLQVFWGLWYEHKQLPWQGGVCCISLSKLPQCGAACAGSSLTPGDGVGSAAACASWLLWAGLFCSSWGRAEIPTCAAWKTSNKGLEKVTDTIGQLETGNKFLEKKLFDNQQCFSFDPWLGTWKCSLQCSGIRDFWTMISTSAECWARFPVLFCYLEERFAALACCALSFFCSSALNTRIVFFSRRESRFRFGWHLCVWDCTRTWW